LSWLTRHPRWTFPFPPISASWLNAVENFFSMITREHIRRGVFRSIADLQAAINSYLAEHNASPKPFVWTKSAEAILANPTFATPGIEAAKLEVFHGVRSKGRHHTGRCHGAATSTEAILGDG